MIRNLCAKDVRMMYLQISSEVAEKGISVSAREMINIICHNVYATFVKETHVYIQGWHIRSFYEAKLHIHAETNVPSRVCSFVL